jgi:hypothetical protein
VTENREEGQPLAVPSTFSWMCIIRPGKYNLDHEQEENEEKHDHPDADQPYRNAVSLVLAFSQEDFVQGLAGHQAIDAFIRYISLRFSHVAKLPSTRARLP